MKSMFNVVGILVLLSTVGCAHSHKVEGPQEKSEIPAGVRVAIGGKEVKEGDLLAVYKATCRRVSQGRAETVDECKDNHVGSAIVLKVLDHDAAIVSPQNGLVMDTSMKVEKQKGEQQ